MARMSPFPPREVGQQNRHSGGGIAGISPFLAGKWDIRRKYGKARAGGGESVGPAPRGPGRARDGAARPSCGSNAVPKAGEAAGYFVDTAR